MLHYTNQFFLDKTKALPKLRKQKWKKWPSPVKKNKNVHKSYLNSAVEFRTKCVTKHMLRTCYIWLWYQSNMLIRPLVIRPWFCLLLFSLIFYCFVKFRLISFCFEFVLQVTLFSNFVLELKFNKIITFFGDKKYKTIMNNQRTLKVMHWYESILELDF